MSSARRENSEIMGGQSVLKKYFEYIIIRDYGTLSAGTGSSKCIRVCKAWKTTFRSPARYLLYKRKVLRDAEASQ
jgi:hypothetical protein